MDEWKVPTNVLNAWTGSNFFLAEKMCEDFNFKVIEHSKRINNIFITKIEIKWQ